MDAVRVSPETGRAYVSEKDLVASEEFQRSIERMRTLLDDKLRHSEESKR